MNHETALSKAKDIADRVLAPAARQHDKEGRFSAESVAALGQAGLLGLMLPSELGGAGLGPRSFAAVTTTLAEADASVAMVYLMHASAAATIAAARPRCGGRADPRRDRRRTASVDARLQRSRLAQPFLDAGLPCAPKRGRRAHHGEEVLGHERRPCAELRRLVARARRGGSDRFDPLPRSGGHAGAVGRGPLGRHGIAGQCLRADDARRLRGSVRAPAHRGRRGLPGDAERGAAAVQSGSGGRGAGPLSRGGRGDGGASQERAIRASGPEPRREPADAAGAARDDADRHRWPRGAHRRL